MLNFSYHIFSQLYHFNPFVPNAPFPYPLKTPENLSFLMFSGVTETVYREQIG